jgi:hemerythrin superfamily protein
MNAISKFSPGITRMIRMDHTHVLATFHKYQIDSSPDRKKALVNTICTALEIHAQLEEEIFYPAMRSIDPSVVESSVPEHQQMRGLIAQLRPMRPTDAGYDNAVMDLMRIVMHHVADEETTLLPEAERTLGDRLHELGAQMTRRRFELAAPRAGEIAINTARSFPGAIVATAAIVVLGALVARHAYVARQGVFGSLLARRARLI